jgi:putative transcriptional regulator
LFYTTGELYELHFAFTEKANISQQALAKAAGWNQPRLANYEKSLRVPSLADSRHIVAALNTLGVSCSLDDVFLQNPQILGRNKNANHLF